MRIRPINLMPHFMALPPGIIWLYWQSAHLVQLIRHIVG